MKLNTTLACLLKIALTALAVSAAPVEHVVLDHDKPVVISIGARSATTLQFPRPIRGIFGYGLTKGDAPGTYHYVHPEGSRLLALRNVMPDKETHVSVLLGQSDLFVLHLKPGLDPPLAVHLRNPDDLVRQRQARQVSADALEERRLDPQTSRLFNLLKLGKNERTFRIAVPHLYQNVESREVDYRRDDGEVETLVSKIHRFPEEDATFLHATIENKTESALQFHPGSLEVSVGKRTYPVALVDSSSIIPAKGKIPLHVIVRGGVEGERAHLSIKNEFRLVMPASGPCLDDPGLIDALGTVLEPPPDYEGPDVSLFPDPAEKGGSK